MSNGDPEDAVFGAGCEGGGNAVVPRCNEAEKYDVLISPLSLIHILTAESQRCSADFPRLTLGKGQERAMGHPLLVRDEGHRQSRSAVEDTVSVVCEAELETASPSLDSGD